MKASDVLLDNSFCAKAEVLLLKVGLSKISLILCCLPKGQTQAPGGTKRGVQGALTEEPGLDKGGSQSLPLREEDTGCSLLPKQPVLLCTVPTVLLTELSLSLGCSSVLPGLDKLIYSQPEHRPCSGI